MKSNDPAMIGGQPVWVWQCPEEKRDAWEKNQPGRSAPAFYKPGAEQFNTHNHDWVLKSDPGKWHEDRRKRKLAEKRAMLAL